MRLTQGKHNENPIRIFSAFDGEKLYPESMKSDLDRLRKARRADVSVLSSEPKEFSVSEEATALPAVRFYSLIGSARIEGFFHRGKRKTLYVMFNGSRTRNGGKALASLPSFSRWSWFTDTDASFISLEDPMFYKFPECTLGWYYGTKNEDYRKYCAQCISKTAELLEIENSDIVLYGSSGGGTAAIGVSRYLPGCSVVAINPQLFLEKYPYSEELEKITCMKLGSEPDAFVRNDNWRIIRENTDAVYFLIENVRSDGDYVTQFRAFCEKAEINPGFGIEKNGNIVSWLYDAQGAPSTHSAVENSSIFKMIDLLIGYIREKQDINELKNLYDVINEFWYERSSLMRERYYQDKKIKEISEEKVALSRENDRMRKDLDWGWIKAGVRLKKLLGKVKRKMGR